MGLCIEVLDDAIRIHGKPEIFNTDQGCHFTRVSIHRCTQKNDIRISMDGKGRWMDNVFVERLWRSLKYEEVYLYAYNNINAATTGINNWMIFFNEIRRHSNLDQHTTDQVYYNLPSGLPLAA
jgi:putative transposase